MLSGVSGSIDHARPARRADANPQERKDPMAGKKKKSSEAMIISKSRVKAAVKKCNVGGE